MNSDTYVQTLYAPNRMDISNHPTIFLAGTTISSSSSLSSWRESLIASLTSTKPPLGQVVILNPQRYDWDSTWREDRSDARWSEQVDWELDMQRDASVVVVYFGGVSDAPISLLEFGLCAASGRCVVYIDREYRKRGNVEAVCERLGVPIAETQSGLTHEVVKKLRELHLCHS